MADFKSSQVSVSIEKKAGQFIVSVGEDGRLSRRTFKDEGSALRYKEAEEKRLRLG